MISRDILRVSFGVAVALLAACSRARSERPPLVSTVKICEVVAAPQRYENRLITFRARFSSDCYHGFNVISDFPCRYHGLGANADAAMAAAKSRALYDALCPSAWNYYTDVTAVFTAVVRRTRDDSFLLRPRAEFELALLDYRDLKRVKRSMY